MLLHLLVSLPGTAFAFLGSSQLSTKVQVKGPLWGRLTPNPLLMLQLPWGQVGCQNRCKDVPNNDPCLLSLDVAIQHINLVLTESCSESSEPVPA